LVEDIRLLAVCSHEEEGYGSQKDEIVASNCLSTVELGDKELREAVISQFMSKFRKLSEVIYRPFFPSLFYIFSVVQTMIPHVP